MISKPAKVLFLISNILVLTSLLPLSGNPPPNQTGVWLPFDLQRGGPSFLLLYENEAGENQDFVVEVKAVIQSDNISFRIISTKKIREKVSDAEYFAISGVGTESFAFSSYRFGLQLDTELNKTIKHSVAVSGQYRINEGEWQAFELYNYFPTKLKLFEDHEFWYNLTIEFEILKLTGSLVLIYGMSDVGYTIALSEDSEQFYNITTHWVMLEISSEGDFGNAQGLYKVTTFERSPIIGFYSPSIGVVGVCLVLLTTYLIRKIIRIKNRS